jgi:DNA-3-methyladenine glycosylase II
MEDHYRSLAALDPVLADLMQGYGQPDPFEWSDGGRTGSSRFAAMMLHIVGQQISTVVAFVIFDRIAAATGGVPTPDAILALGAERLRECGLSRAKAGYILDLARSQASGLIDLEAMAALGDAEAIAALTAVRGIGLWSAEMFLIHQLHRPDVLPAGDVGLRRAIGIAWELPAVPGVNEVRTRAAAWSPHRTYAATLLWRSLRPVEEPFDQKARALDRAADRAAPTTDGTGHDLR